jgi:hypothetical protein
MLQAISKEANLKLRGERKGRDISQRKPVLKFLNESKG